MKMVPRLGATWPATIPALIGMIAACSSLPVSVPWARAFGGTGLETAVDVAESKIDDTSYVVAQSTNSFEEGSTSLWLLRVGGLAEIKTQHLIQTDRGESNPRLAGAADGGVFVASTTYSFSARGADVWFARINPQGAFEWQLRIGSPRDDIMTALTTTASGDVVAVGHTQLPGTADTDAMIIRLSGDASVEAVNTLGGPASERLFAVAARSDGGIYVAGQVNDSLGDDAFVARLSAEGELLWAYRLNGEDNEGLKAIAVTDTGWIAVGGTDLTPGGRGKGLVVTGGEDGAITAQFTLGLETASELSSVVVGQTGDTVAGGTVTTGSNTTDVWLVRLASNGTSSGFAYGGEANETGTRIRPATDGGLWVSAATASFQAQATDIKLIRMKTDLFLPAPLRRDANPTKEVTSLAVIPSSVVVGELATDFAPTTATLQTTSGRIRPIAGN